MRKYSKGEIAKIILLTFVMSGMVVAVSAAPGLAYLFKLFSARTYTEKARVRQSIKHLEKKKFITIQQKDGSEIITITSHGREKIKEYQLYNLIIDKQRRWDGLWRIVTFDIPEERKKARNALCRTLQRIGFYHLQKSVFVYPYPCKKEIEFVKEYFEVHEYVKYITAQEMDNSATPIKFFKL